MILEFTLHASSALECDYARTALDDALGVYLFETGKHFYRSQQHADSSDSQKAVGVLDCSDNDENARYLLHCLLGITAEHKGVAVTVRDCDSDQDFLLTETCETENDDAERAVSRALMHDGFVHVYKGLDEMAAIRYARIPSKSKPSESRTKVLRNRIGDVSSLVDHSRHHHEVILSFRAAVFLADHPYLVPQVVYKAVEDIEDDGKTLEYEQLLLAGFPDTCVTRSLRFTRLAFATINHATDGNVKDSGRSLGKGIARLLHENTEFEKLFEKQWLKQTTPDNDRSEEAETKAREILYGTKNPAHDAWHDLNNLSKYLHVVVDRNRVQNLSSVGNDDASWLKDRPDAHQGAEDGKEQFRDFARTFAQTAAGDHTIDGIKAVSIASAIHQSGNHAIEFSADEFFRILGAQ